MKNTLRTLNSLYAEAAINISKIDEIRLWSKSTLAQKIELEKW